MQGNKNGYFRNNESHFFNVFIENIFKKSTLYILIFLSFITIIQFSPLKGYIYFFLTRIHNSYTGNPLKEILFILFVILYINCGGLRILIYPAAGIIFGYFYGLILSQFSIILAYYIFFAVLRYFIRNKAFSDYLVNKTVKINDLIKRNGISSVILIRQIPVCGFLVNIALALSPIRHSDFLLGTLIGTLPIALVCTFLGSGLYDISPERLLVLSSLLLVVFSCIWILCIKKKYKKKEAI